MKPEVSIALTTYNGERYLREQLDSLFAQTWSHFHVIAVDDGSSDATVSILREYEQSHSLEVHVNETNLGFVKNFEKAIRLCRGTHIALCDQDDIWEPEKLAVLLDHSDGNTLVYSDARLVDEEGRDLDRTLSDLHGLQFVRGDVAVNLVLYECMSGNTMLFPSSLCDHFLPIPSNFPFHDIWIAFVAASLGRIDYVREPLVRYRRHEQNITYQAGVSDYDAFRDGRTWVRNRRRLRRRLRNLLDCATIRHEEQALVAELADRLNGVQDRWFDPSLFRFLFSRRHDLYAIKRQKRYFVRVLDLSTGFRFVRWRIGLRERLRRLGLWKSRRV